MYLIVDSGSTKTLWCLINNDKIIQEISTPGMNPYISSITQIQQIIESDVLPILQHKPEKIFFYGAGCSSTENKKIIADELRKINTDAKIEVEHDLLAVARSLCLYESGIAVILGTGSNSCLYNGREIVKNTPSLGYILGDEGSGSNIGKQFLADLWLDNIPSDLKELFFKDYPKDLNFYLTKVYKEPNPNAFLASFCEWLSVHKQNKYVHDLLMNSFNNFFEKQILPYGVDVTTTINCIGSIAFYFQNEWKEVILHHGYQIGEIEQTPILGLIQYHSTWKE